MKALLFDVETSSVEDFVLLEGVDHLNCIVTMEPSGTVARYHDDPELPRDGTLADGLRVLSMAEVLIGHNIQGFDVPIVEKLGGVRIAAELIDTEVMTKVLWSDVKDQDFKRSRRLERMGRTYDLPKRLFGSQSLEAWGYRLGEHKGQKPVDWDVLTTDMLRYCEQDVRTNAALWRTILKRKLPAGIRRLEHEFALRIRDQVRNGIRYDREASDVLTQTLDVQVSALADELGTMFPDFVEHYVTPKRREHKTRTITFNPGSREHLARGLQEKHGWKPKVFTPNGKPKMDEDVLEGLDYPEARTMLEYLLLKKRLGQIATGSKAWVKHVRDDGRIYASVNHNGTITHRCAHSNPNLGQVPKVGKPFGQECRSLFVPTEGWTMVGMDLSGIEMRGMSHYLHPYDEGRYVKIVLEGDPHLVNQELIEAKTKDEAKTWFYAWLYGAQPPKLASIQGVSVSLAKARQKRFLERTPGMGPLRRRCQREHKTRGYVISIDGRRTPTRSPHSAMNTLFQSFGAIVMKIVTVQWHRGLAAAGLEEGRDYRQLLHVHDEAQFESRPEVARQVLDVGLAVVPEVGESLKLHCPLAAAGATGSSWAETH